MCPPSSPCAWLARITIASAFQRIMAVISKYAKDKGYTLILDVSSQQTPVLFAADEDLSV